MAEAHSDNGNEGNRRGLARITEHRLQKITSNTVM